MEKTYITLIPHAVPQLYRLHNIPQAKLIFIIIIKVPYINTVPGEIATGIFIRAWSVDKSIIII